MIVLGPARGDRKAKDKNDMSGELENMGHTQAKHFLQTFLKALSTHDYESVEQLRRTLAIMHYRRSINRGEHICETEVVPRTGQVEKWLALLDRDLGELRTELTSLLASLDDEKAS